MRISLIFSSTSERDFLSTLSGAISRILREARSAENCLINRIVLCELVWVLESAYRYRRTVIADALEKILRTIQFTVEDVEACWGALEAYRTTRVGFADALLGRTNRIMGCRTTITFDGEPSQLRDFKLLE